MAKQVGRKPVRRPEKAKSTRIARSAGHSAASARRKARPAPAKSHAKLPAGSRPVAKVGRPVSRVARARRPSSGPAPVLPTPHNDAVATYERGLQALQSRQYDKASALLQSVIDLYADEKELHERARLYLNVALRHSRPLDPTPQSVEERVYAATLQVNSGRLDEALATLSALERDVPDHDYAQFMLAIVQLNRGEPDEALRHLVRAVELNPENRLGALQDTELAPLREQPGFRTAIERAAQRGRRSAGRASR